MWTCVSFHQWCSMYSWIYWILDHLLKRKWGNKKIIEFIYVIISCSWAPTSPLPLHTYITTALTESESQFQQTDTKTHNKAKKKCYQTTKMCQPKKEKKNNLIGHEWKKSKSRHLDNFKKTGWRFPLWRFQWSKGWNHVSPRSYVRLWWIVDYQERVRGLRALHLQGHSTIPQSECHWLLVQFFG